MDFVEWSFDEMRKQGVPSNQIYVMCSSGVLARFGDRAKLDNQTKLQAEVKKIVDKQEVEKNGGKEFEA